MLKQLITNLVSRLFPSLYDEILQEAHQEYLEKGIGAKKGSLAFDILKNRKLFDDVTDGMGKDKGEKR